MDLEIPERFNAAVYFVDRNLQAGRGDKIAIRHEGRSYTYRDIAGLVNRWGNVLRGLGVEAERRIALLCLDSPEFVAGFFGAIRVGVVPIPLNTLLRPAEYEYLLNDSRARLLLVHRELWEPLTPLRDRCGFLRHVVVIGDVNPGAEITAGGNVIVWGRLRGVVHAGAGGDEEAVVCALDLAPTQLRIAGHIAVSPERRKDPGPEIARIREGQLIADTWKDSRQR